MEQSEGIKSDNFHVAEKKSPLQKVGEFLKEARQGRNLSVEDLSSSLRIGKEQLIALEDGDEQSLPEKVYIRAMVRRIAEKLDLDTSFILDELNEKKKKVQEPNPLIKKKITRKRFFSPFSMVLLSGVLGLLTSIIALKYIQRAQNDSISSLRSNIFLLEKTSIFKVY